MKLFYSMLACVLTTFSLNAVEASSASSVEDPSIVVLTEVRAGSPPFKQVGVVVSKNTTVADVIKQIKNRYPELESENLGVYIRGVFLEDSQKLLEYSPVDITLDPILLVGKKRVSVKDRIRALESKR